MRALSILTGSIGGLAGDWARASPGAAATANAAIMIKAIERFVMSEPARLKDIWFSPATRRPLDRRN